MHKSKQLFSTYMPIYYTDGPPAGIEVYFNDAVHPHCNTRPDYALIMKGNAYEVCSTGGSSSACHHLEEQLLCHPGQHL